MTSFVADGQGPYVALGTGQNEAELGAYGGSGGGGTTGGAGGSVSGISISAIAITAGTSGANTASVILGPILAERRHGITQGGLQLCLIATNAVTAETNDGAVDLTETAQGGNGGTATLGAGAAGGNGTTDTTFNDTTNADQSASITVSDNAFGGSGGGGTTTGGAGGNGAIVEAITGSGTVTVGESGRRYRRQWQY